MARTTKYYDDFVVLGVQSHGNAEHTEATIDCIKAFFKGEVYTFPTIWETITWYKQLKTDLCLNDQFRLITYCYRLKRVNSFIHFDEEFGGDFINNHNSRKVQEGIEEETTYVIATPYFEFRDGFSLTKQPLEDIPVEREIKELYDGITSLMQLYNDDLKSIPLTATGYPRRDIRRVCKASKDYSRWFSQTRLTAPQYFMCLKAFKGGLCYLNPNFEGELLTSNDTFRLMHRDFRSHYPSQLRTRLYPTGPVENYYDIESISYKMGNTPQLTVDEVLKDTKYTYVVYMLIKDLKLKDGVTFPILSDTDLVYPEETAVIKNHHVVSSEKNAIYIDSITLKWMKKQYDFKSIIQKAIRMKNGKLPKEYNAVIDKYFIEKSDKSKPEFEHMVDKKKLVSIYGCFVTKPVRRLVLNVDSNLQKDLDRYYKDRSSFLPYQIGIMVTAYARDELLQYIETIGYNKVIYCDTDSAFYLSDDNVEAKVEALNAKKEKKAPKVTLKDGSELCYDSFEIEHHLKQFKGLSSKVYGYVTDDDVFSVTIGGMPEKGPDGVKREDEVGCLENLSFETQFRSCARIIIKWLDEGYIRYRQEVSLIRDELKRG